MKQLGFGFGLVVVLAIGPLSIVFRPVALAQGQARDESGALATTATGAQKSRFQERFAGSYAELSSYVGTGSFYVSGYRNPYLSTALYLKPVYQLGTKRDLTLNARVYIETEYTQPDNPQARRFYPLDTWLWVAARNLYTEPRSKIRFSGLARLVLPTSYESRYAHLLAGVAIGGSATRAFEFGRPDAQGKRWGLGLTLGTSFSKGIHSSVLRGNGPGDSTGCMAASSQPTATGAAEPSAAASDRCGGPLNTSFGILTAGGAALTRGRWALSMTLILMNQFRYTAPTDAFSSTNTPLGRDDSTWGIVSVGYDIRPHLGVAAGVSSAQPALDSRYRYPRFPFFDFSATNEKNYTQLFANINGTL